MFKDDWSHSFAPAPEAVAHVAALRERLDTQRCTAVVVGAGKSGFAAYRLLMSRGIKVRMVDDRPTEVWNTGSCASIPIRETGLLSEDQLRDADLVVLSPGVPRNHKVLLPSIQNGKVIGEIELASWFLRLPLVGITGTNGKSTTTTLVAHILRQNSGRNIFAGGNLGVPLSELALAPEGVDVAVVELSSYQLESIVEAQFKVACWLNLSPDHTDRYESMDSYAAAKRRILERRSIGGTAVLNAKDSYCSSAGIRMGGDVRWFSANNTSDLARSMGTLLGLNGQATRTCNEQVEVYSLNNPALLGLHNKANALAAIECARNIGASVDDVQKGLSTFTGLSHRLELVGELSGVRWFNDSKATNVESACIAVSALEQPAILILGGRDKGSSWEPLLRAAKAAQVRAVLVIGEAADLIQTVFEGHVEILEKAVTLEVAVSHAKEISRPGEDVLFSPACASFDQFKNYAERGDTFKRLVVGDRGER